MTLPIQIHDIEDGCLLTVETCINGKQACFIVDTGASRTCIDPASLDRYIDQPRLESREGQAVGLGCQQLEQMTVTIDSLSLGDTVLQHLQLVAVDLSHIRDFCISQGLPDFVGILGGDVLRRLRASINYRRRTLTVQRPK